MNEYLQEVVDLAFDARSQMPNLGFQPGHAGLPGKACLGEQKLELPSIQGSSPKLGLKACWGQGQSTLSLSE